MSGTNGPPRTPSSGAKHTASTTTTTTTTASTASTAPTPPQSPTPPLPTSSGLSRSSNSLFAHTAPVPAAAAIANNGNNGNNSTAAHAVLSASTSSVAPLVSAAGAGAVPAAGAGVASGASSPAVPLSPAAASDDVASPSSRQSGLSGGFGLLNKFGINRRAKTASMSQMALGTALLEASFLVGPKKKNLKKRFVVLDARTIHVCDSELKSTIDEQMLLVFCFVRSDPADRRLFTVYNKSRELVFSDDDAPKVAMWASAVAAAADRARAEELSNSGVDPRELAPDPDDRPDKNANNNNNNNNDNDDDDLSDDATAATLAADTAAGSTTVGGGDVRKAGYLSKRNKRGKFKKRWIVLTAQFLHFYNDADEAKSDAAKESLQLLFCSAKPAMGADAPHGFSIFAKDQTHEFLAASAAEQQAWLAAIQAESERLMLENLGQTTKSDAAAAAADAGADDATSVTASVAAASQPQSLAASGVLRRSADDHDGSGDDVGSARADATSSRAKALQDEVEELLCRPENALCADCSAPGPEWCSVNIGLFVCIECSGVHRRLGAHISKVRSTTLDVLLPEHIAQLRAWGNVKANEVWESLPIADGAKPAPDAISETRSHFIHDKYKNRRYHSKSRTTSPRGAKPSLLLPATAAELHTSTGRRQLSDALLLLLSADVALRNELCSRLLPDELVLDADGAAAPASPARRKKSTALPGATGVVADLPRASSSSRRGQRTGK